MKFANGLYTVLAGAALLTANSALSADAVEAQKTAQYSLLPNFHGTIDLRQYRLVEKTADGDKESPLVQSRLIAGSTFMNDKLDIVGVMAVSARPQTEKISQRRPEIDITYAAFSNDYVDITPELYIFTPHQGSATDGQPGLMVGLKAPAADLGFATLKTSMTGEWLTKLSSRSADAQVENETSKPLSELGLVGADPEDNSVGTRKDGKEDLDFAAEYMAAANLSSGKVSLDLSQWLDQVYNPRYTATDDGIEVSRPVVTTTSQRVKVAYKVTDKTTLSNETWFQQGGAFEREFQGTDENKGLPAFSNIIKATYAL